MVTAGAPPEDVRAAFGAHGEPRRLPGGQGSAWLVGEVVLKPLDLAEEVLAWTDALLASVRCDGFRVPRARHALDGSRVVGGWCAWERLEGRHETGRWAEIIGVGDRFHAALADVPEPAFIARRTDPWAVADRVAWGEEPLGPFAVLPHVARLACARRPLGAARQLVHGDLTGNVLFADGLPPAIIDLSLYWRPPAFASAVVVADALVWHGADERLLEAVGQVTDIGQYLLRALIFRAVAEELFRGGTSADADAADRYGAAVESALRVAAPI